jgi:thiamine kinase-like enzyme
MRPDPDPIIDRVPGWANASDLRVQPMGGLTNANYLVTVDTERFVLRVSGQNSGLLGIQRGLEREALEAAAAAGIGPDMVHFILPEGHLVTRFIEGRHWTADEYRTPTNLRRMVETVKHLHSLPAIQARFCPFRRVEAYARRARRLRGSLPGDFDAFAERMGAVEAAQRQDGRTWLRFCHNDLFSVNFLDDGTVRLVDWEFAGMGDIHFDLAALVYAYDTHAPLPAEEQEYLLECYFGEVTDAHQARLEGMKHVLLLFTAMWGLLQQGLLAHGLIPEVEGFDYLQYAHNILDVLRETL